MKPKMAMGSPGSFPRRLIVPVSFLQVFVIDNPQVSDVRAVEYGSYLRWLRHRGVQVARRPWETVHCAETIRMYYEFLRANAYARNTRRLDRAIALRVRRLARIRLSGALGTQYVMPNGAMAGTHTTVYGREYTREVDNPAEPNNRYLVVRDVYRRHEVWQTGDRWGERQD